MRCNIKHVTGPNGTTQAQCQIHGIYMSDVFESGDTCPMGHIADVEDRFAFFAAEERGTYSEHITKVFGKIKELSDRVTSLEKKNMALAKLLTAAENTDIET